MYRYFLLIMGLLALSGCGSVSSGGATTIEQVVSACRTSRSSDVCELSAREKMCLKLREELLKPYDSFEECNEVCNQNKIRAWSGQQSSECRGLAWTASVWCRKYCGTKYGGIK